MKKHGLGLEVHLTHDDKASEFADHVQFIKSCHLPFGGINYAAIDDEVRTNSLEVTKATMEQAAGLGVTKVVLHPLGVWEENGVHVGEYDIFVASMRELVPVAERLKLEVCVENMVLRAPTTNVRYGCTVEEWWGILDILNSPAFRLTLDTSHAASNATHGATPEERVKLLWHYLDRPELISHVHWSDAMMMDGTTKYQDMHLIPGKGDIPLDFHKAVLNLNATVVMEQHCSDEACAEGLDFANIVMNGK
ncbi:MAG: sugar phosphate isomerase/epimerase [Victivallales bacterium]|nr:sugar phosphate isomerase/epimerase [Victivallales bacterium]